MCATRVLSEVCGECYAHEPCCRFCVHDMQVTCATCTSLCVARAVYVLVALLVCVCIIKCVTSSLSYVAHLC